MLDLLEKAFNLGHTFAVNTAGEYMKLLYIRVFHK